MLGKSFWGAEQEAPMLRGRIAADVAIAGGGLSGLTCALWLSRAGLRVALVEANELCSGSSAHCAGVISLAKGSLYADLEKLRGVETARFCAETLQSAMKAVEEMARYGKVKHRFLSSCLIGKEEQVYRETEAMKRAGVSSRMLRLKIEERPSEIALMLENTAILHMGEYLFCLARAAKEAGAKLYAHSRVTAIDIQELYTERGSVQAPYMVIATGYPILNFPGWYFSRMQQYHCSLAPLNTQRSMDQMYQSIDGNWNLRPFAKGALLAWRENLAGCTDGSSTFPEDVAKLGFPCAMHSYSGLECYTADGLPFIGTYGSSTPNLFVAAGYGGMGILGSMMAAQAISAQILGLPSRGYEIYSGQRRLRSFNTPLAIGGRYARGVLMHPSAPRCPHMGCKLVHNPASKLWECPCHGSRFDDIGHVLNAPAVRDAVLRDRRS